VDEVTTALTLVAYYITDAISLWASEFSGMITAFNFNNGLLCLFICLFLILFHILSCECFVFPHLVADYTLMRKVF
jgi:hypothetical protein